MVSNDVVTPAAVAKGGVRKWRHSYWLFSPPMFVLLALFLVAIFAPVLATHGPMTPNPAEKLQPPSAAHYFGTDPFGMDVYSRTLYATRTDLTISLLSVFLGVLIGVPMGAFAGYVRGLPDGILLRSMEILQAFPQILFAMAFMAVFGNNIPNLIVIIGLMNIPVYMRMVRSVVLPLRESDFVLAARSAGHGSWSLVGKHLLPNSLVPVFSQFSLSCAFAVQMVAGLSFIGLGVRIPEPEWGSMINQGAGYIVFGQWWPAFFPGLAVFLTAFSLNALGQRIRKTLLRE